MNWPILFSAAWLILLASCHNREEQPPRLYSIEQFMDVKSILNAGFSSDESKLLISSNESGIFNVYELELSTGQQKQLTHSAEESIFAASYFPNDDRIVFTSDKGGNEIVHIYVRHADGTAVDIINSPTAKANFYGWSFDKQYLYFTSNARNPQYFDLYRVDITRSSPDKPNYPAELVYQNDEGLDPAALSRDNRYIVLVKSITTNDADMYLLDTRTGQKQHISPHTGEVNYRPQYFSPDGSKLIYLTNEGSEFMYVASYDLATGEKTKVEEAPWDIMNTYLSRSGRYRVVAINNDARTEIKMYDESDGGRLVQLKNVPPGDITGLIISDSEKWLTFYVSTSSSPSNLFLYNLETDEIRQLTQTLSPEIDPADLVEATVVRFPSYDGMEIPALLYRPKGLKKGQKVPALVQVHGGPGGQTRLNYNSTFQYLVNHGYAILCVNNRGSSGYGKTFYAADDRKHGDVDLKDCIYGKKYLQTLDFIDPEKIGIYGGSYGGYMVMAALTFAPEEFAVGVNLFGVTNWLRTLKSIPPWWGSFRDALYHEMGDPVKDSVALYNKSPLFHAHRIKRPFIVLQGSNDPRVLQVESDEIVAAARTNGVPVEYVIFPDEGHGWVKKENQIKSAEAILRFLDKYLKGSGQSVELP